ncbi:Cytochrome c' [Caenispirillum salinarum AK4]|uniref:Cytochrome c n=1 Tax=Caenispirillum salinarum AK4 TaxID=1238182 RepID=K9HTE1_9PROT|nr:cytochrome c [Caenispirillum salinarum]EKV31546.1 Cytochrome c' [Caenispirillum salinarum AK4]
MIRSRPVLAVFPGLMIAGAGLFAALPASSHTTGAPPLVEERQAAMEDMKDAMKVLGPMVKGEAPFDAAQAAEAAAVIHGVSTRIPDFYPTDSTYYEPGHALPAVWEESDAFRDEAAEALEAAAALREAVDGAGAAAAIAPAVKEVAETCRACHDDFKKDED